MPSRAKKIDRDVAKLPSIPKELVELFLTGPMTGEAINDAGLAFKKALIEASLKAELSHHLGSESGSEKPDQATNHRNGGTAKTVGMVRSGSRRHVTARAVSSRCCCRSMPAGSPRSTTRSWRCMRAG